MDIKQRIVKARKEAGMSQDQLALATGKSRSAVAQWESGEVRPRHKTIVQIAEATSKPLLWLESGVGDGGVGLMVIGKVAAGVWKEGSVSFSPYDIPYSPRSDFPAHAQRLYEVEGTSINRLAREGQFLHAVSVQESGVKPEDGDLVVVRRMEHGMAEYTAKVLVRAGDDYVLKPASDDPEWQTEIKFTGDDSTEIEITDVVIGVVAPIFRRRR